MCYNKEISLITYIIGTSLSLYLFLIGDKYDKNIALLFFTFIQMQLVEFFMWTNQNCNIYNKLATIFGHIILCLQPLLILVGSYIYNTTIINKNIILFLIIINLFSILSVIYKYIKNNKKFICSKSYNNDGLKWDIGSVSFIGYIFYFFGLFFIWPFFKNKKKGILIFLLTLFTLIKNTYDFKNNKIKETWESHWCFESVSIPIIYLILLKFNLL
jgi:hypothetical protein